MEPLPFMLLGDYPYYVHVEFKYENREKRYYHHSRLQAFDLTCRHEALVTIQKTPYRVDDSNELILDELHLVESPQNDHVICNSDDADGAIMGLIAEHGIFKRYAPLISVPERSLYDIIGNDVSGLLIWGQLMEELSYKQFPKVVDMDVDITYHQMIQRSRGLSEKKKEVVYGPDGEKLPRADDDQPILGLDDLPF